MKQTELTEEQLEGAIGGIGGPVGLDLNFAVAPQVNVILFSKVTESTVGGAIIGQLNVSRQTQVASPQLSRLFGL